MTKIICDFCNKEIERAGVFGNENHFIVEVYKDNADAKRLGLTIKLDACKRCAEELFGYPKAECDE